MRPGLLPHLSIWSYFFETIAAVHRPVATRLKRDFGFFSALGANHREHLARRSEATALSFRFSGLPTIGTAFRFVGVTFGLEELLVFHAKDKRGTAIAALKGLVLKTQWMTSSLNY